MYLMEKNMNNITFYYFLCNFVNYNHIIFKSKIKLGICKF